MRWLLNYAKMEFQLDFLAHDDHERHVFVVMNWWHAFSQTANWHRFSFQARQWLEKIISTATFFSQSSVPRYCDRWEFLKYSSEQLRFNYNLSYLKLHRIDFCMIQYRFIEVCRERDRGDLNQSSRVSLSVVIIPYSVQVLCCFALDRSFRSCLHGSERELLWSDDKFLSHFSKNLILSCWDVVIWCQWHTIVFRFIRMSFL